MCACGAGRLYLQSRVYDFSRQPLGVIDGSRPGPGQPNIRVVDSKSIHQMENMRLVLNRRVPDRGGLQTITECLVMEFDPMRRRFCYFLRLVPVENQRACHVISYSAPDMTPFDTCP